MPTKAGQASSKAIPKAIKVAFNACRIPDHDDVFYCTLTVANVGLAKTASAAEARTAGGLLRRKAFETAAVETLEAARAAGQDVEITFIEFVGADRSEEHTSELQSLMRISYAVFRLKKKTNKHN